MSVMYPTPADKHSVMLDETIGYILSMVDITMNEGQCSRKQLRNKIPEVYKQIIGIRDRVRGNRPVGSEVDWSDIRLMLAATLREGLRMLGEQEELE